jgi:hypothetical protein
VSSSAQLANAVQGARAVAAQGDVRGAFALLDRALGGASGALGGDDPDVLAATCVLAKLHTDLGELSDARRVLEQGLAAGYHKLGDGHAVMLALSYELARIADELGNVYEAKRRYGQLARLGPAALGEDHPSVRAARRYLGLSEPEGPFHAPHQSAPAPFEPLSAPIGTTGRPQPTWPVDQHAGAAADDRPIFHPESRQEAQPAPPWHPGEQDSWSGGPAGTRFEDRPARSDEQDGRDDGPQETLHGDGWQQVDQGVLQRSDLPPWPSPDPADPTSGGAYPTSGGAYPVSGDLQERSPWTPPLPEQDVARRRSPLVALLVILIVAVLGGITAAVVSFLAARPDSPAARQEGQPPASVAASGSGPSGAAADTPKAPGALKLRDDKTSITLTWTDPSKGSAPFIVAGGQQGALRQLQVLAAGVTTYTLNGLNPKLDYCFTVAAVYGTDSVALSDLACTQRK